MLCKVTGVIELCRKAEEMPSYGFVSHTWVFPENMFLRPSAIHWNAFPDLLWNRRGVWFLRASVERQCSIILPSKALRLLFCFHHMYLMLLWGSDNFHPPPDPRKISVEFSRASLGVATTELQMNIILLLRQQGGTFQIFSRSHFHTIPPTEFVFNLKDISV